MAYSGDTNYVGGTSSPVPLAVTKSATTGDLTVSGSANYGQPLTLRAALSSDSGAYPDGPVTFMDGSRVLGTATLANGVATFTTSSLTIGPHRFRAVYAGDAEFQPCTSATVRQVIAISTQLALSSSAMFVPAGTSVTFTAVLSAFAPADLMPTGSVTFFDGRKALGTASLVNGVATFSTSRLATRLHSICASYSGNSVFPAATSAVVAQTIAFPTVLDVMVLYTPQAAQRVGSTRAMQKLINNAVGDMNQAFSNSRIDVTVRLVYKGEVNYTESGEFQTDLDRLRGTRDRYMDQVHALRDRYGADLVSLFEGSGDGGGLAYTFSPNGRGQDSYGFSVMLAKQAAAPDYTFAHELGHNLGAVHDPDNSDNPGAYSYSYGYRFRVGRTVCHDIMAYDPGTTIPYYSNPDVTYAGVPTGSATANVARTINQVAPTVAAYRRSDYQAVSPTITAVASSTPTATRGRTFTINIRVADTGTDATTPVGTILLRDGASILGTLTLSRRGRATWTGSLPTAGTHCITALFLGGDGFIASLSSVLVERILRPR